MYYLRGIVIPLGRSPVDRVPTVVLLGAGYRGSNWSKFAFGGVILLGRAFSEIRPPEFDVNDDVSVGGEAGSIGVEDDWDSGGYGIFEGLGVSISDSIGRWERRWRKGDGNGDD
ncbi:hypothetical protein [Methanopyrus kandleri]